MYVVIILMYAATDIDYIYICNPPIGGFCHSFYGEEKSYVHISVDSGPDISPYNWRVTISDVWQRF